MKTEDLEKTVCKDCELQKNCIAIDKKIMVNVYHCPAFKMLEKHLLILQRFISSVETEFKVIL